MTLRRKLLVAFSIMTVPLLVIGGLTLWNIREENQALRALEEGLGRVRIFAELESAVHRQVLKIRDYLTGWDKGAKREFDWLERVVRELAEEWKGAVSHPEDVQLAEDFDRLHREIKDLAEKAFTAYERGRGDEAIRLVQQEIDGRLFPDLDRKIKTIYRSFRIHNVKSALDRLEAIQDFTRMVLIVSVLSSVVLVALSSILISRNLARPVEELKRAMDIVGAGRLDAAIEVRSRDEIGDLARSFTDMTQKLKETQDQLIQSEKLASLGQMAAAVAHGLRNPLASIRAATQLSLRRVPREDPLREQLGSVIGEVDRLEKRITHLLDFTKPSPYRPVAEKPERLFQDVLPTFSEKFTQQEIRLRSIMPGISRRSGSIPSRSSWHCWKSSPMAWKRCPKEACSPSPRAVVSREAQHAGAPMSKSSSRTREGGSPRTCGHVSLNPSSPRRRTEPDWVWPSPSDSSSRTKAP